MDKEEILEKMIKRYATSYYKGNPEIPDLAFDKLVDELRSINPKNKLLNTPGWGYDPGNRKVEHWYGLTIGSLDKLDDGVDIIPERFTSNYSRVSAKLDGISVVSYYVNGELVQAITRGNGTHGIDITSKIKTILTACGTDKITYNNVSFTGAIRGEVLMPVELFNKYYDKSANQGLNPRNLAAGIMNRDDDSDLDQVRYVVYKVLASESHKFTSITMIDHFLQENFTYRAPYLYYIDTGSKFKSMYDRYKEEYPCDGLVFSNMSAMEDSIINWDEIAYKFEAEKKEVIIKEITWNATRTGRIVPLIWFDPIELSGAMVQKCTGFNAQFIKDNQIGIGSRITVNRSHEVIPDLQEVLEATGASLPTICPNCGTPLKWSGVDLICDNENETQLAYHFISTLAPLDGAGYSLYNSIVEGLSLEGLYELDKFLENLNPDNTLSLLIDTGKISGEVSKQRTYKVLETLVNPVDPIQFMVACSIPGISEATASAILNKIPDFIIRLSKGDNLYNDLIEIQGIGETVINRLLKYKDRIITLSHKMKFKEIEVPKKAQFKVAITGALSIKRADFDNKLKERGIEQSGNWREIKYLITNNPDSGSSKTKMAKDKGIEIISEEEFTKKYLM